MRLYAAYGSNLCLEQMAYRCPTAKVHAAGWLKDYQLFFQGTPGNAYANIVPQEGSQVPVLVWQLQPRDEKALDRYEGYPRFYTKTTVLIAQEDGAPFKAMAYVMTDLRTERSRPSASYLQSIVQGYESAGFDTDILAGALKRSCTDSRLDMRK